MARKYRRRNFPQSTEVGDLNTRITFYQYKPSEGHWPGDEEAEKVYSCWAAIEGVYESQIQLAKQNDTLTDLTMKIRDNTMEFNPDTKHWVEIDHPNYRGTRYGIDVVKPDLINKRYLLISGSVKENV